LQLINEYDTYTKHRCYTYDSTCICECVDAPEFTDYNQHQDANDLATTVRKNFTNRFQEGTVQGKDVVTAGLVKRYSDHKERRWNQFGHLGQMEHQKIFFAKDRFWKPPSYYVPHEEILALKACCEQEVLLDVDFISPAGTCEEYRLLPPAVIKKHLMAMSPTLTNAALTNWLANAGCNDKVVYGTQTDGNTGDQGYDYSQNGPDYDVNDMHHASQSQRDAWDGQTRGSLRSTIPVAVNRHVAGAPQPGSHSSGLPKHEVKGTRNDEDYQY
jgi:hypothetical protein